MNKLALLTILGISTIIGIYALNSWTEDLLRERADYQRQFLNETISAKFKENFERQNFLGNNTIFHLANLSEVELKILNERTPLFNAIIENQRTIIHNQYRFSLPENLNVTGISNHTDNLNLSKH